MHVCPIYSTKECILIWIYHAERYTDFFSKLIIGITALIVIGVSLFCMVIIKFCFDSYDLIDSYIWFESFDVFD